VKVCDRLAELLAFHLNVGETSALCCLRGRGLAIGASLMHSCEHRVAALEAELRTLARVFFSLLGTVAAVTSPSLYLFRHTRLRVDRFVAASSRI
jgi:hypothetical protein